MRNATPGFRGPPHRRRASRAPRARLAGRVFWLVPAVAAIGIVSSGFAAGAFLIGTFGSVPNQAAAQGAPQAPPGVTFVLAQAEVVGAGTTPATGACTASNLGTVATPTALTDGTNTGICLSTSATGFAGGDLMYVLELSFGPTAALSTQFQVQIGVGVTPSANSVTAVSVVETSATITNYENATYALDLAQKGDTSIVQFSLLVTQL